MANARLTLADLPPELLKRKVKGGMTLEEALKDPVEPTPQQAMVAKGRMPQGPKMNGLETKYSQELDRTKQFSYRRVHIR